MIVNMALELKDRVRHKLWDPEVFTSGTYLWHRYSITVNHVMVATVKLSK
jgi:hypothetical protein